ncbi:RDD family protein [Kitasatospora sp. NPDC001309]|uniref:RDD family protein n=1 Tax=Kitasatospora sp. NPDC001309 TaxID=3364013 RepID=UPI0036ACCEB7
MATPPPNAPWYAPGPAPAGPLLPSPRPPKKPRPVAIPGLAGWAQRATATGIELGIAGGLMTAYTCALYLAKPAFALLQLIALLADADIRGWLAGGYWLVGAAWLVTQWVIRGQTGESIGQRLVGVVVVDEDTGAPIGPARSILRGLLHVVDVLPMGIGFARPVTHPRRQTWADSISRTVVVQRAFIDSIAEVRR